MSELARRGGVSLRRIGTVDLVDAADAPAFLDACASAGTRVLGVEGFHVVDGGVVPDMEAIADFSSLTDSNESVREARAFVVATADPDLAFEFILE